MKTNLKPALIAALILGLFAIAGSTLVSFTHEQTAERIAENQRQALLRQLNKLIPAERFDNDMLTDTRIIQAPQWLGHEFSTVYHARQQGSLVALVFEISTQRGYNGSIDLLVGVNTDGSLAGVRVVNHRETPGLGDKIEEQRSDWILSFTGRSLTDPREKDWKVKRDGGFFDQFTGATITPRAIVAAVKNTLIYYRDHAEQLSGDPS